MAAKGVLFGGFAGGAIPYLLGMAHEAVGGQAVPCRQGCRWISVLRRDRYVHLTRNGLGAVFLGAVFLLVAMGLAGASGRALAQDETTPGRSTRETSERVAATIDSLDGQRGALRKVNLDSPSKFFAVQVRLFALRNTVENARQLVRSLMDSYRRTSTIAAPVTRDLATVRSGGNADSVLAACRRLYYGGDPRVFDLTPASCRENYSPANDFYSRSRIQADADSVTAQRLALQVDSARMAVDTVSAAVDAAGERLDNEILGRFAYKMALWLIGGTSILLVAILLVARADRGRPAFSVAHATELVTVLAVVMAVIFFGSIRALGGESVAGLLAGIVGYVLGQRSQRRGGAEPSKPE